MALTKITDKQVTYKQGSTGSVVRNLGEKLRETVSVKDFGAVGDGSDETIKLQKAINEAQNKLLVLDGSKQYLYSSLTFPDNITVRFNGATMRRIAASTSHGIILNGNIDIDKLVVSTPGGTGGDKAVAIRGSNVHIGNLSVVADAQGDESSTNWAVEIESSPVGTNLSRIHIDNLYCKNFSTAYFAKHISMCSVNNAVVEFYRLAFYLKDVARFTSENVICRELGAGSNGSPGENGLLIESSLSSGSSNQLSFKSWYVTDSGEHAYRLGGQLSIRDVWFQNCTAEKSGSSILGGNTSSGEWHGGCGFKVLGGNSTITEFHQNIHFDNCGVIDCNMTYGAYPDGHGVNNFTPWLIVMAKNIHLTSCWTKAAHQPTVARNGILFTAVDGLFLDNCNFRDTDLTAIKPYQETPIPGYPGSDLPIKNLMVSGGIYECTTPLVGRGIPFYMEEGADTDHENWTVNGAVLKGGGTAVRIQTPATGSYADLNFDFTYVGTNVNDSTYTTPSVAGNGVLGALIKTVAPWRPLASNPSVANGSVWTSPNDGEIRTRVDSVWKKEPKSYTVSIADDSFATVTPPAADTGFIAVTAGGTATHLFGWYRATSSPQSLKYAGASQAVMVNTTLDGTTGTDGNVTVGIQNGVIYIENRSGTSNTFKVAFII